MCRLFLGRKSEHGLYFDNVVSIQSEQIWFLKDFYAILMRMHVFVIFTKEYQNIFESLDITKSYKVLRQAYPKNTLFHSLYFS